MSTHDAAISRLQAVLREWDAGGKAVRRRLLQDFVAQHAAPRTAPELDAEWADAASLFLARVCAWLRLTYMIGTCLSEQLQALQIFITASSGHRFLEELIEAGGVLTVLEVLGVRQAREGDRAEALQLLLDVAGAGRRYKELICESYGIRATAECLAKSRAELTQERARRLLQTLAEGNPRFEGQVYRGLIALLPASSARAQQLAAQTLRTVQPIVGKSHPAIVEPLLNLLKTLHAEVQYEAIELMKLLVNYEARDALLPGLVRLLTLSQDLLRRTPDICADDAVDKLTSALPVFVQQAAAAKAIRILLMAASTVAEEFLQLPVLSGLMCAMGRTDYAESQRQASMTLEFFCHTFSAVGATVQDAIGDSLYDLLMLDAEALCDKMTPVQTDILLSNKISKGSVTDARRTP